MKRSRAAGYAVYLNVVGSSPSSFMASVSEVGRRISANPQGMLSSFVANWFINHVTGRDVLMLLVPDSFAGGKIGGAHCVRIKSASHVRAKRRRERRRR